MIPSTTSIPTVETGATRTGSRGRMLRAAFADTIFLIEALIAPWSLLQARDD
jgi:hypothetical protein